MLTRAKTWAWAAVLAVGVAFVWAPAGVRFSGALLDALIFASALSWFPQCRPRVKTPLCPWNWALMLYFLQLVGLPLLITLNGPAEGVLPQLPSPFAINAAMVVNSIAFLAVCWSYNHSIRAATADATSHLTRMPDDSSRDRDVPVRLIVLFAVAGLTGVFLSFGSLGGIWDYFNNPAFYREYLLDLSSTWRGFFSLLLKPFLGFAVIMTWCRWMDRGGREATWWVRGGVTLLLVASVVISFGTFSYNRGAFVFPLIAIASVTLVKRDKASWRMMFITGVLVFALAPLYALYRTSTVLGGDLLDRPDLQDLVLEKSDFSGMAQMYGSAPQYFGYLLEASHWGSNPHWGRVTISSMLSPLPVLGKPFRSGSGTAIYNQMIYGTTEIQDQVVPFSGETFLDFNILGVVIGFSLLGWVLARLQLAFEASRSSLELYIWQYLSVCTCFLIFGSASVVSQFWIYFFWPIYLYLARSRSVRSASPAQQSGTSSFARLGA